MNKLRALFHPIFIFVGVQIAWIILMAFWIYWYIKNNRTIKEFAKRIQPEIFTTDINWVILLEGCFLMLVILAGVYIIFVYWNKQARLNRMQSNFVSSVSHELKSPLASIQLYLETMKYQDVSKDETKDFVETMLTDTERLSGLIENIMQASKFDPKKSQFQFHSVAMEPFITDLVKGHKRQFEEKEFKVSLEIVDSPVLKIDKRAMRMVFNNLVGNALRYSNRGSPFTIRMQNNKKYCQIQFIDSGIGFEKKEMKKIFKKFYRVQNRETQDIEGAGLGLYISKEVVKNHKGKIDVTSRGKDQGSIFTVSLPMPKESRGTDH